VTYSYSIDVASGMGNWHMVAILADSVEKRSKPPQCELTLSFCILLKGMKLEYTNLRYPTASKLQIKD
jgi:hypothetical protein